MTSIQQTGPLNDLSPEIYPIIAEHLPLCVTPSTLLALALTNHHISKIVSPLIYSRLILRNEDDALRVFQKLLADSTLGLMVRELHVMSELSLSTRNEENTFDVIEGIKPIINKGLLPFVHTLGLHINSLWHYDYDNPFVAAADIGHLTPEFWTALRGNCPKLKALVLDGFRDDPDEPWLDESGTLEVPDLTSLSVHFRQFSMSKDGCKKLVNHISTLFFSLHTLSLAPNSDDWTDVAPILSLRFPKLRSLKLSSFNGIITEDAMAFWKSHPALQHIDLSNNSKESPWFSRELPTDFLPNLRHFRAHFNDVRFLAPILPQLLSLSITRSVNAQVPYLLRIIIPDGLPNLRSLHIDQLPSSGRKNVNVEGALWYEDAEGVSHKVPWKKQDCYGVIFANYVHSISRSAPNLEELAFHVIATDPLERLIGIADEFGEFKQLKRFYFTGRGRSTLFSNIKEEARNTLLSQAKQFAAAVPSLISITDVNVLSLPYATVRIERDASSGVVGASFGKGYGLLIGHDDEAFPVFPR